jgi:hypothetical protein
VRWLFLLLVCACYAPTPQPGSPCDDEHPCPTPLICAAGTGHCERTDVDASALSDAPIDVLIPGCTVSGAELCGDGIDQDCDGNDPACLANDRPAGAIDVTAGGTFDADVTFSRDDAPQRGCLSDGGRDVFYRVTTASSQLYYFDTFGSTFDSIVRVFPGTACTGITGNMTPSCDHDSCGGKNAQLVVTLPSGTSCVVVDQKAGQTSGTMKLRVIAGGRVGIPLAAGISTLTGDTCASTNQTDPNITCNAVQNGKDIGYWFTACPGETRRVDASTCAAPANTHFDTALYVRPASGTDLVCIDDTQTCGVRPDRVDMTPDGVIVTNIPAVGPGLFWVVVDGFDAGACGGYQLDTNLHQ